jgi:cysteine synthase A
VIVAEPDNSRVLGSGIPQPRDNEGSPSASHPEFRPHLMQGWSPDFISSLTEAAVAAGWVDEVVPVSGDEALRLSRELARQEGIFVGISSGATLDAALQIARRSPQGTNIVCMLPDTGERYLSTPLFADIGEQMDEEEMALSRSTAGYQFAVPAAVTEVDDDDRPDAGGEEKPRLTPALDVTARDFVDSTIGEEPVVVFALQWCEFCWSVRKMFDALGVAYTSVDLDSVAYQEDERGGKIRAVLAEYTGTPTIPQIYLGGEHLGGATDVLAAFDNGSLQYRLRKLGLTYRQDVAMTSAELLPQWLQPRQSA